MVGIDLRDVRILRGQFYVACSRVSFVSSLVILASKGFTKNVYKEVLGKIKYINLNDGEVLCHRKVIMIVSQNLTASKRVPQNYYF